MQNENALLSYFLQRTKRLQRRGYATALLLFDSLLLLALYCLTKKHMCRDWCCWFMWYKVPCCGTRIMMVVANVGGM
jgi:hypothetical protein